MTEEEIRKEMCRIFMEDDDFDIYMREWDKKTLGDKKSPKNFKDTNENSF